MSKLDIDFEKELWDAANEIVELIRSNLGVSMDRELIFLFIFVVAGYGANIF